MALALEHKIDKIKLKLKNKQLPLEVEAISKSSRHSLRIKSFNQKNFFVQLFTILDRDRDLAKPKSCVSDFPCRRSNRESPLLMHTGPKIKEGYRKTNKKEGEKLIHSSNKIIILKFDYFSS